MSWREYSRVLSTLLGKETRLLSASATITSSLDQVAEGKTEDGEKEDDGTTDMLAEFARLRVYLEGVKGRLQ
jgi:hypothetical protein